MTAGSIDFRRNAQRWLAWVPQMRARVTDLYGAEPQLCVMLLGVPYVDLLHRLNVIEAECRRHADFANDDEQATV